MTDDKQNIPVTPEDGFVDNYIEKEDAAAAPPPAEERTDDGMKDRLERLGGEPAPVITPEEFARLQKMGQVNIDARGRVRTARRSGEENEGVTLRKRRAWYDR
jgi:hypothetical protein